MKKNGFTLIELLAGLALIGIISSIVFSILFTGIKQGENTKKDVSLQQEANYLATKLRKEYLSIKDFNGSSQFVLTVSEHQILLNGAVISDQFQYDAKIIYESDEYTTNQEVVVATKSPVLILITLSNGESSYTLRTTLTRGV